MLKGLWGRKEGSVHFGRIKADEANAVSFATGRRNFANDVSRNVIFFARWHIGRHERQIIVFIMVGRMQLVVKFGASGTKLLSRFVAELN